MLVHVTNVDRQNRSRREADRLGDGRQDQRQRGQPRGVGVV